MSRGTFARLSDQLQAAHDQHERWDYAALRAKSEGRKESAAGATAAMKAENVKCARLGSALAAISPETPTDALRLVSLASCWAQIMGDAIGDDSAVEAEFQNLTAALEGLTAHLLAAVPKPQRRPALLGFTAYLGSEAQRLFPRECDAIHERNKAAP